MLVIFSSSGSFDTVMLKLSMPSVIESSLYLNFKVKSVCPLGTVIVAGRVIGVATDAP